MRVFQRKFSVENYSNLISEFIVLCQMVANSRLHVAECIVPCQMVANGKLHVAECIVLCQMLPNDI